MDCTIRRRLLSARTASSLRRMAFSQFERSSLTLEVGVSHRQCGAKNWFAVTENVDRQHRSAACWIRRVRPQQTTVLDAKSMQVLPNVGQDWQNFTILLPGSIRRYPGSCRDAARSSPGQASLGSTAICRTATCWRMVHRQPFRTVPKLGCKYL